MKHARDLIHPDVLKWPPKSASSAVAEATKVLQTKPEHVIAWEDGNSNPSTPQLREMAAAHTRPQWIR